VSIFFLPISRISFLFSSHSLFPYSFLRFLVSSDAYIFIFSFAVYSFSLTKLSEPVKSWHEWNAILLFSQQVVGFSFSSTPNKICQAQILGTLVNYGYTCFTDVSSVWDGNHIARSNYSITCWLLFPSSKESQQAAERF
jgi:hypothetical protein